MIPDDALDSMEWRSLRPLSSNKSALGNTRYPTWSSP